MYLSAYLMCLLLCIDCLSVSVSAQSAHSMQEQRMSTKTSQLHLAYFLVRFSPSPLMARGRALISQSSIPWRRFRRVHTHSKFDGKSRVFSSTQLMHWATKVVQLTLASIFF